MNFKELTLCAILISFAGGVFYEFNSDADIEPVRSTQSKRKHKVTLEEFTPANTAPPLTNTLKPCSETTMMPCDVSPPNPVKDSLDAKPQRDGLFKKGEMITCIYQGIFWWTDRNEFVKAVPMVGKVVQASEAFDDLEKDYQHIQVDFSKDLAFKSSDQPGVGMVKDHKLNYKVQWMPSTDCYHFVQQ